MNNNINFLLFLAFSLLFFGCEQTVFINQNDYKPRVAVESEILVDSVAKIYLTETQNYYGYVDYQTPAKYIEDAKVVITSNGVSDELTPSLGKIDTLIVYMGYDPNKGDIYDTIYTKQKYYRGHNIIKKGQEYKLSITHEGKETTSELSIANLTFAKTEAEQKEEEIKQGAFSYLDKYFEVRVKDPVGVGNYYRIKMYYKSLQYQYVYNPATQQYEQDTLEINVKELGNIFSDEANDGGIIKTRNYPNLFSYTPEDTGYVPIFIQVECLDTPSGKYWESIFNQNMTQGNPFTEPVILYSNIKNGVGFFGTTQIVDTLTFMYKKKYY
jgi:hypothetical protein